MNYGASTTVDKDYLQLCEYILNYGNVKGDRTGNGTRSIFGGRIHLDISEKFPILTTKKVSFHSVAGELLWFLSGANDISYLTENKIKIWDSWAKSHKDVFRVPDEVYEQLDKRTKAFYDNKTVGNMYGHQWRKWSCIEVDDETGDFVVIPKDQIMELITNLKRIPDSRRHVVSAWNPNDMPDETKSHLENIQDGKGVLAACHALFQCYVNDGKLSLQIYQRSADMFLGVPFNIASYALLAHMIAQVCGYKAHELIWIGGDCHIYNNHIDQMKEQIERFKSGKTHPYPKLKLNPDIHNINDFKLTDIELEGYVSEPAIKGDVAV